MDDLEHQIERCIENMLAEGDSEFGYDTAGTVQRIMVLVHDEVSYAETSAMLEASRM